MFQIIYISNATNKFEQNPTKEMDRILDTANSFNKRRGITGMLLLKDGLFLQLIEGEYDEVVKLYGKICLDKRHSYQRVLYAGEIEQRVFPSWTMAYQDLGQKGLPDLGYMNTITEFYKNSDKKEKIDSDEIKKIFITLRSMLNKKAA